MEPLNIKNLIPLECSMHSTEFLKLRFVSTAAAILRHCRHL